MTETNPNIADLDTEVELHQPVTEDERAAAAATASAAARTAACYAVDAKDLRMLLAMLGVAGPMGAPPCSNCTEPITRLANGGYNRSAGDGLCGKCFQARRNRAERKARKAVQ